LAACGDGEPKPKASEVAAYLDAKLGFDYELVSFGSETVVTGFRGAQVRIHVFDSEDDLREEQESLGDLVPTSVTCGVIDVWVAADQMPDRVAVEQGHGRAVEQALDEKYDC
jgi:hypothetical protein